jgi:hypothetical protein
VVIDQNPVNTPAPVGAQAPPRPPEKPSDRASSRRESIANAFKKSREGVEIPAAKPRIGHNQPPEAIDAEKAAAPPRQQTSTIDLRRPPLRGRGGRFAPQAPQPGQQSGQQPGQQRAPQQYAELPHNAPYRQVPSRMKPEAQRAWHATPDHVRGEVHRMLKEFHGFYQKAKSDIDVMQSIRPYHELAKSQGTSLERALSNYVTMENKLREDPIAGLDVLIHNMNLRTSDGYQLTLPDVARYVLSRTPEQHALTQSGNVQGAHNAQIAQLNQQVQQLTNALHHMHNQQQFAQRYTQTRHGVDRFAETHPRTDELAPAITQELRAGYSLEQAYQRATLLHPHPAAQTRGPSPQPAQTRAADRSISGAPAGAPVSGRAARRPGVPPPSRRDIIANAVRRVNGSL